MQLKPATPSRVCGIYFHDPQRPLGCQYPVASLSLVADMRLIA
jgi:hypothetical protein